MAASTTRNAQDAESKLLSFERLSTEAHSRDTRLGRLHFRDRPSIDTPHYVAVSSRGTVPHLTQDMMRDNTRINAVYTALEDSDILAHWSSQVIEKASHQSQTPPVYNYPASALESPLRKFISLQNNALLILGPRRIPPLPCSASSTNSTISIVTSLGFGTLEYTDYAEAAQKLRPDIVIGMGDVLHGHKPGVKRADRMGDRTLAWMNELVGAIRDEEHGTPRTALFAPILPIETEQQSYYLDALRDDLLDDISGFVLYDVASTDAVPDSMNHLPRLYLGPSSSPHKLLDAIALGIDLFTIPFIAEATDAGIALDFSFPSPRSESTTTPLPLGIDMWSPTLATSLTPLRKDCQCYTCQNHHRAFIRHLLDAKEMLGWVLLQLHNHHTINEFFKGVRGTLHNGTFEDERVLFGRLYEAELPEKSGQGPRVRGYQFKSDKGEVRRNPLAYRALDDGKEALAEAALPSPSADAQDLERQGFAEQVD